jgi:hypothetical protein
MGGQAQPIYVIVSRKQCRNRDIDTVCMVCMYEVKPFIDDQA